jgi:hypothetical protein
MSSKIGSGHAKAPIGPDIGTASAGRRATEAGSAERNRFRLFYLKLHANSKCIETTASEPAVTILGRNIDRHYCGVEAFAKSL